jgi:hypothetical protein
MALLLVAFCEESQRENGKRYERVRKKKKGEVRLWCKRLGETGPG